MSIPAPKPLPSPVAESRQTPSAVEQARMVEALLFASPQPMSLAAIEGALPPGCDAATAVENLDEIYQGRGIELVRVGNGYAFRTAADLAGLFSKTIVLRRKLSRAATETLAIIAYHQPVTRNEIEEIRGVAVSGGTLAQLLELDWIRVGRRRKSPGRPATFTITQGFLDHFGLESPKDLPGLAELRASGLLRSHPPAGFVAKASAPPNPAFGDGAELRDKV